MTACTLFTCCRHAVCMMYPKIQSTSFHPFPGCLRASTLALSSLWPRFDPGIGRSLNTQVSGPFALICIFLKKLFLACCMCVACRMAACCTVSIRMKEKTSSAIFFQSGHPSCCLTYGHPSCCLTYGHPSSCLTYGHPSCCLTYH